MRQTQPPDVRGVTVMGLRRRCYSLALALVCGLVAGASHPAELALRASLAIDGHGREIRKPVIIVRRERISSIKSLGEVPPSVQLIDLPGFTLLPGLIDAHVHVTGYFPNQTSRRLPPTLWAARNARCLLESGFTTVRSLGSRLFEDVQLRDAIDQGLVPGPRLLVSGQPLKAPGTRRTGGEEGAPPARRMSEDRMRLLARRQLNGRIDWLKVFASESVRRGGGATYSEEELRWAVEEAHKRGVPVAAHAHAAEAARRAVAAGVTTIEHGALLDENTLQLLQETGTYLVPNLYLSEYYLRHWDRFGFGEEAKKLTEAALPQRTKVFRRAVEMGVKIVFGTDATAGWISSGTTAVEFERRVAAGQSPRDALISATGLAAEALLLADKIGDLQEGLLADIIAVDGNPLEDITALGRIVFVMKRGKVYLTPAAPLTSSCTVLEPSVASTFLNPS